MIAALNNATTTLNQLSDTPALTAYVRAAAQSIEKADASKLAPQLMKDMASQDFTAGTLVNVLQNIMVSGMVLHYRAFNSIAMMADIQGDNVLAGLLEKTRELSQFEAHVKLQAEHFTAADPNRTLAALVIWAPGRNTVKLFDTLPMMMRKVRSMQFLMDDMLIAMAIENIDALMRLNYSLDVHLHKAVVADGKVDVYKTVQPQYLPK